MHLQSSSSRSLRPLLRSVVTFAASVWLLSCLALAQTTTTLTGTIVDSSGNPLNGTLTMRLPVPAQYTPTNKAVAPSPVTYNLVNGVIQGGAILPLYDVQALQPQGLYYIARAYDLTGALQFYGNYVVTGASFNLGAATPTSITTSNISYLLPITSTSSNTFTAAQTFTTINSISSPDAATGFIRMASGDTVCWRNGGNTNDACIGETTIGGGDFFSVNAAGGMAVASGVVETQAAPGLLLQAITPSNTVGTPIHITAGSATAANSNGGDILITPGSLNGAARNGSIDLHYGVGRAVVSNGTGFQHQRTASCTTGAGAGSTCNTTVFWQANFTDTTYTATCTVSGGTGAVTGTPYVLNTSSKTASQIVVTIVNLTAVASSGTLDCIGVHD